MASLPLDKLLVEEAAPLWEWRTGLSTVPLASQSSDREITERLNKYVAECVACGKRPLATGMALAAGFNGPTEMRRAALRRPRLLPLISRALTLVASHYEEMIGETNSAGPIFMLKNIPDFDMEAPHEPAVYTFKDTVQVDTKVQGQVVHTHEDASLSPREVYLKVIRGVTIENAEYVEIEPEAPTTLPGRLDIIIANTNAD